MENNTVNATINSPINLSQLAAASMIPGQGRVRAKKPRDSDSTRRTLVDNVDLMGLETYAQAFKILRSIEAISIPEPVRQAIQTLAKQVFGESPGGSVR